MNKIKKVIIFVLFLILTSFVNFASLLFRLRECGLKPWPCYSESSNLLIFTNYPNFFIKASCINNWGLQCFPARFSLGLLIFDIILALIFFFVLLGIIKIFKKSN